MSLIAFYSSIDIGKTVHVSLFVVGRICLDDIQTGVGIQTIRSIFAVIVAAQQGLRHRFIVDTVVTHVFVPS